VRKLWEESFSVLDLETTSGKFDASGILEIGLVKIEGGKLTRSFSSLVNPGYPIPPIVERMTGISQEMVENAPKFEAIVENVEAFISTDIVVLHNSPFDLQFLNIQLEKLGKPRFTNPILCTVKLGHLLCPEAPNRRLETLAHHLNIPLLAHHRAWSDAETTAKIFLVYLDRLRKKGVETFFQLYLWMMKHAGSRTH
jgi:DNA polymerase III epsilon subunit family exonuclease